MKQNHRIVILILSLALIIFLQGCIKNNDETTVQEETAVPITETPKKNTEQATSTLDPSPTNIQPAVITRETELLVEATATPPPVFSPDVLETITPGEYLIYTYRDGLEIASVSGENRLILASLVHDWTIFSPNKQFIAFSKSGAPFIYDIKNNREVNLMFKDGDCFSPDWSPDSQEVLYSCHTYEGWDLILFSISDLLHQKITDCEAIKFSCRRPNWSSDGKKIAYVRSPAYSGESTDEGLYILETECIREKNCGTGYGPFPFMFAYAWSPDSSQLAGISHGELLIYEYKDHALLLVKSLGQVGIAETIVWSPDGRYLAVSSVRGIAYKYSLDHDQIEILAIPSDARLRGWIRFP